MIAFTPKGNLASFTGDTTAPTSVRSLGTSGEQAQQYKLSNISSTIDCVVGWGQSDAEAKLNAAAGASAINCTYLLRGTVEVITAPPGAYFSGITPSSTAVIKVQSGLGN